MRKSRYSLLLFLFSLAVLSSAYSQTALQYIPIPTGPCRLLDTRNPGSGGPLLAGQTRTVTVPQVSPCDIPTGALAYSFNVAVVPHQPLDFLTVWPTGVPRPTVATLNSYDERIKTVAAIVAAGTGGDLNVYATNTTDLILDFNGYFVAPGNDSALAYYPVAPCRILDTRSGQYVHGNQPAVNFTIAGKCGIPSSGAQAFSLNFAAIPRTRSLDFMVAYAGGTNQPMTATVNAPTGAVTADAGLVQSGTGAGSGQISVFSTDDIDLVIDTNGYFAAPGETGQLLLYPLTPPCRALDTRNGQPLMGGQTLTVQVESSVCSVPAAAQGYVVNATVLPQPILGFLTLWAHGTLPVSSTLNALDGAVTSNLAIVPANSTNGTFLAYGPNNTQLIVDIFGFMAPPVTITTPSLPEGSEGQSYAAQLAASGGLPPYTWSTTSGGLPPGLTLAGTGAISGTPTTSGLFSFTVQAADTSHNTGSAPLSIAVSDGRLAITTSQLPGGTQGVHYQATLGAIGGVPPYAWSVASGSLPSGLTLNSGSGVISGTPQSGGPSNFTVEVTDAIREDVTAPLGIVVHASVNDSALDGDYAFSFSGFQSGKPIFLAGSLVANGQGAITAGILDLNTGTGSPAQGTSFVGTYTLGGNGVGTMSLNAGTLGTLNFHFALAAGGQGQFIWDNADPNPRGSGLLLMQTPPDFYQPQPGSFTIGSFGADVNFQRYAVAGAFVVTTGGVVSSGSEDVNDNGVLGGATFTGRFLGINTRSGRGQAQFTIDGVVNNYAYYTIRQGHVLIIGIDALAANDPLTLGTFLVQQSNGFTNASLHGTTVLQTTGLAPNNGSPIADVLLGLATWNGSGTGTFSLDENRGGTITQQQASHGTYAVAANGRVTLTGFGGNTPILYLANANQAFVLGQTNTVAFGLLEQQTATPPYNNLSILGTYLGGTLDPAQSAIIDSVGYLFADGNGNLTGVANTSGPSGTGTQNYSATYQVDATGRAVLTGTPAGFLYLVSSGNVMFLPRGSTPALNVFSAGLTN